MTYYWDILMDYERQIGIRFLKGSPDSPGKFQMFFWKYEVGFLITN